MSLQTICTLSNISLTSNNIITTPQSVLEPTESIGFTMFKHMKIHQDAIAQIDASTGEKDTYKNLLQRSIRTAIYMRNHGVNENDIITLCTTNHLDCAVPFIASQFLGAVIASIDPSFSQQEMEHLLNTVKPKIIFSVTESVERIEKVLAALSLSTKIVVFGETQKHISFSNCLKSHESEEAFEPVKIENLKNTAIIYFSSGTTGLPKGICISHYSLLGNIINHKSFDLKNVDSELIKSMKKRISLPVTCLYYTTLYWISAGCMLLYSIMDGSCRLLCKNFNGVEIWNLFEKYKPSFLMLTPVQAIEMLANVRQDVNTDFLISLVVMGSALSKEYILKLHEVFPQTEIILGYGQTEVAGSVTSFKFLEKSHNQIKRRPEKIESVGLPNQGILYKVVDTETNQNLGPNQKGELRIKSKFLMNGYYNADSSDTFDEDGWLKTGDIVYYDEDFCFYIIDRIKEAFKYQGWFIAPTLLENELLKHPAVKIAAVIGIPKEDGCHAMGLVVLHNGFKVTEKEIEKFVEERVSERQRLRAGVKFLKSIPLTVTGKIKRTELKEMILNGAL